MTNVYASDLKPGMIIEAKGLRFYIEDAHSTGENRIKVTWHPLGQVPRHHTPVTVMPGNIYKLIPPLTIEELPL